MAFLRTAEWRKKARKRLSPKIGIAFTCNKKTERKYVTCADRSWCNHLYIYIKRWEYIYILEPATRICRICNSMHLTMLDLKTIWRTMWKFCFIKASVKKFNPDKLRVWKKKQKRINYEMARRSKQRGVVERSFSSPNYRIHTAGLREVSSVLLGFRYFIQILVESNNSLNSGESAEVGTFLNFRIVQ